MSESFKNDRLSFGTVDDSFSIKWGWQKMNNSRLIYAVTRSVSETLSYTNFEDRFPPFVS